MLKQNHLNVCALATRKYRNRKPHLWQGAHSSSFVANRDHATLRNSLIISLSSSLSPSLVLPFCRNLFLALNLLSLLVLKQLLRLGQLLQ